MKIHALQEFTGIWEIFWTSMGLRIEVELMLPISKGGTIFQLIPDYI